MKTILQQTRRIYRVSGSLFNGMLVPASTQDMFDRVLEEVRSADPNATHYCYGWRIGYPDTAEFARDDGEPAGTAGKPILNQLKSAGLLQAGCIVTRHFGGTKLGKTGLIEAYGHTAELCLNEASLYTLIPTVVFRFRFPYELQSLISKWSHNYGLITRETDYLEQVSLTVTCPAENSTAFARELERSGHLLTGVERMGESLEIEGKS